MGQILVKTPITSNGRDPIMGADGKIMYRETILEEAAQKILEKQNSKKPTHLKAIIEPYNPAKAPIKEVEEEEEVFEIYDEPEVKPTKKTTKRGPKAK